MAIVETSYRYNVNWIVETRDLLSEAICFEYLNRNLSLADVKNIAQLVKELVSDNLVEDVLVESMRHLLGKQLQKAGARALSWRITGNVDRLRQQHAVPLWHGQRLREWVPVQIISGHKKFNAKKRLVVDYTFRIIGGTAAGLSTKKTWSIKFCRFIARDFGFSKSGGTRRFRKFPYSSPEQLVGLRLHVLLDPEVSGKEPGFRDIRHTTTTKSFNSEMLGLRFRTNKQFKCLVELPETKMPCHKCYVGFSKCIAGTHKSDWVVGRCNHCNRDEVFFDPERSSDRCISCVMNES